MKKTIIISLVSLFLFLYVTNHLKSQSVIALPVPEEGTSYCMKLKNDQKVKKSIAEINLYLKKINSSLLFKNCFLDLKIFVKFFIIFLSLSRDQPQLKTIDHYY